MNDRDEPRGYRSHRRMRRQHVHGNVGIDRAVLHRPPDVLPPTGGIHSGLQAAGSDNTDLIQRRYESQIPAS